MFTLEAAKASFFDRKQLTDRLDRATYNALSNLGARVMTTARRSIRKRKRSAPPGQPPSSHVGTLRRGILFARDPSRSSVVIGPILLGSRTGAPENLEWGGFGVVGRGGRRRKAKYLARPYMTPALAAEIPKTPARFANIIH